MKIILSILLLFSEALTANDGAAGLVGGSLVFKNLKGVSMEKERLYISEKEVRVSYEFLNTTDKQIETMIAFPIKWTDECGDTNFDTKDKNPMKFTAKVDGKVIDFKFKKSLNTKKKDPACGELEITLNYYWTQKFPAHKTVKIEHTYTPIFEDGVIYAMELDDKDWLEYFGQYLEKNYCATKKQVSFVRKKKYKYKNLKYILKTANTWDGPIKDFELKIDKGEKPRIFLCTDLNLSKIKNTNMFIARKKNYRPNTDLNIAFVGQFKL